MPAIGSDALLDLLDHTVGTKASLVSVTALNLILPLACFGVALTRWLATRSQLKQAETLAVNAVLGSSAKAPGPVAVLGRVELVPGSDLAYQLLIEQEGRQTEKDGQPNHSWSEQSRDASWSPFYLTDGGRRVVLVEPGRETELVAEPSRTLVQSPTRRTRIIELSPGEELYAVGELVTPTAPNETPVLQASAGGKLLLSTRPLADLHRGWTRYHLVFVSVFAAVLLLAGSLHTPFFLRLTQGEAGEGRVVELETGSWSGSKGNRASCIVHVERPDGLRMSGELNQGIEKSSYTVHACENFVAVGDRVPIVFVRGADGVDQFGRRPGARVDVIISITALALAGLALYSFLPRMFPSKAKRFDEYASGPLQA